MSVLMYNVVCTKRCCIPNSDILGMYTASNIYSTSYEVSDDVSLMINEEIFHKMDRFKNEIFDKPLDITYHRIYYKM